MNAKTNNYPENTQIPQNMYYQSPFYDHGDSEPLKPTIPSYIEDFGIDHREYIMNTNEDVRRRVSDKVQIFQRIVRC